MHTYSGFQPFGHFFQLVNFANIVIWLWFPIKSFCRLGRETIILPSKIGGAASNKKFQAVILQKQLRKYYLV